MSATAGMTIALSFGGLSVLPAADSAFDLRGTGVSLASSTGQGTFTSLPDTYKIFPVTIDAGASPGPRDLIMMTGGEVVVMSGYGLVTTSGSVSIKSTNAGTSGVSGALSFSSGTTSSGNSGMLTIGSGAATVGKGGMVSGWRRCRASC